MTNCTIANVKIIKSHHDIFFSSRQPKLPDTFFHVFLFIKDVFEKTSSEEIQYSKLIGNPTT